MPCPKEITNLWELVKESLRGEMATTVFDLWYAGLKPEDYNPDTGELVFWADSAFKADILTKKHKEKIEERFLSVTGLEVKVSFYSDAPASPAVKKENPLSAPIEDGAEKAQRSRYTFDNFIIGESNKFARAACYKVAQNPSLEWNPLFIHGPSGVGKTHLMYAVINEMLRKQPNLKVIYTKGDEFINYMIDCLSHQAMSDFRDRYRSCDVLLVDDIQFIAGKVATQEEFFHTFQSLFEDGKQIILASDRPPRDINPLEERLRSRFEQGLLADINPPDLELRVAIIKKKAEDIGIDIPDEVLSYLAENLRSNIRQIEGSIKKLAAKSLVDGRRITMELARDCISDLLGDAEPLNVTIDKIFAAVYRKYNVSKEELLGKKRNKEIALARHVTIYLIREVTEMSYPNIGKLFERDHATIMSSLDVIKKRISFDPVFESDMENLKKEIRGH